MSATKGLIKRFFVPFFYVLCSFCFFKQKEYGKFHQSRLYVILISHVYAENVIVLTKKSLRFHSKNDTLTYS